MILYLFCGLLENIPDVPVMYVFNLLSSMETHFVVHEMNLNIFFNANDIIITW